MTSIVAIKQLTSRLESSVSSERIDALQELQAASRTSPDTVGDLGLKNVFDLLRSQSSSEEYSEALDLTSRLIKTRDRDAAMNNTQRILSDEGNVELLLDLLEHSDLMVGVMTSEILTELHTNDREGLEAQIQRCPDGMNKLLQRLPDSSREEVRNQAIVLIQQLTSRNEEMKKTVVFNEGFDILFRIISEEGGSSEANLVVSDCLKICNNIVMGSETCQRLFFAMGTEWILRLSDFFNPMILETMDISYNSLMDQDSNQSSCWFDESNRLSCAVLAIAVLSNSLQFHNAKHQNVIAENAAQVLQSAMYWIGRNGPVELLVASLSLLDAVVAKNVNVAHVLSAMFVKISPNSKGKNIAIDGDVASFQYAWKPLPTDERRCISLLALLAERYVITCRPWKALSTSVLQGDLGFQGDYDTFLHGDNNDSSTGIVHSVNPFLLLFHRIMSVDAMIPDTSVQYVLAPPPPPMGMGDEDEDMYEAAPALLESMRPVCSILFQNLIQFCEKLLSGHMQVSAGLGNNAGAMRADIEGTERLLHLLTVVFMNASLLGRELSTAITTSHCASLLDGQDKRLREIDAENKAILPFILSAIGRAARLPGGFGYPLVKASMVWLATVVCGCERATRMVFEDPANLFVVDLATASSESAGVPSFVQVSVCFFLACCLLALPPEAPEQAGSEGTAAANNSASNGAGVLKRRAFLTVIDSRIGLNRFTETLKRPLLATRKPSSPADNFFTIPDFRAFYEAQVQNVKDVIFEMYSGVSGTVTGMEGAHLQMINVQKAKIQELEEKLHQLQAQPSVSSQSHSLEEVQQLQALLQSKEEELSAAHHAEESMGQQLQESLADLQNEITKTDELREEMKTLQSILDEREQAMQALVASNDSLIQQHRAQADRWKQKEEQYEESILHLKESVLQEASAKKSLAEAVEQKNKKIFLLESELTELQDSRPTEQALMTDARHKLNNFEEECQRLTAEKNHLQRLYESLQQETQDNAAVVAKIKEEGEARDARAQSLEEVIAVLQAEAIQHRENIRVLEENVVHLTEQLQHTNRPSTGSDGSVEQKSEVNQEARLLANKLHDHITRLIQEIANTTEIIGNLPPGVCDDGEVEETSPEDVSELGETTVVSPDDRRLVRAIHKLQNLRLAISFVAGESSEIYEGLNLPLEKLTSGEGTLGRSYEVALELNDVFLQRGDQLYVEVDKLKAALEMYEQKFQTLEEEKSAQVASAAASNSALFEEQIQQLKQHQGELEYNLEEWKEQAEENAAEARHWQTENKILQQQLVELQEKLTAAESPEAPAASATAETTTETSSSSAASTTAQAPAAPDAELLQELQAIIQQLQETLQAQTLSHEETLAAERAAWVQQTQVLMQRLHEKESTAQVQEQQQHQETSSILGHLRTKLAALEAELEKERDDNHQIVAQKDSLLAEYQEDIEGKDKALKEKQSEIVALQNKVIHSQQEHENATTKLQEQQQTVQTLQAQLAAFNKEVQELQVQAQEARTALAQQAETIASNHDREQWEAERASLQSTVQTLQSQLDTLTNQLEVEKQFSLTLKEEIRTKENEFHNLLAAQRATHAEEIAKSQQEFVRKAKEAQQLHETALATAQNQLQQVTHTQALATKALQDLQQRYQADTQELQRSVQREANAVKDLQQSLLVLEENNQEKLALLERKDMRIKELMLNLEDQQERLQHLQEVTEQERQARKENILLNSASVMPVFNNTMQLQDVEIRRLNTTVERVTKELKQREQEVQSLKLQVMKNESELSNLNIQLTTLQGEITRVQQENEHLTQKLADHHEAANSDNHSTGNNSATHHANVQMSIGRFAEYNVLPTSERMQVTEAMHLLHDFMVQMNEKHNVSDYFKTEIYRDLTTQDLPDLALALKRSLQEIISKTDAEIDGFVKILAVKDKEMASLKAHLAAYNSSNSSFHQQNGQQHSVNHSLLLMSPVRSSPPEEPSSDRKTPLRNAATTSATAKDAFVTPLKGRAREPSINAIHSGIKSAADWSAGGSGILMNSVEKSGGRRSVTVTPSAKEAAKYHAELVRERKKLVTLQEEHADLLGLIAQQEVELSVFKEKVQNMLGVAVATTIEREARDHVEKQYGVYTNFREIDDM